MFDKTFNSHLSSEQDRIFYLLCKKFLNHINSFFTLMNGTSFNDVVYNSWQIDHSSSKVLLRAAFESYLTISHLFWNKPALTEFRVLLYKHSGLKERQTKLPRKNLSGDLMTKAKSEAELSKELEKLIEAASSKLSLTTKYVSKALTDGWRTGKGWIKIGHDSPLPNSYVESIYPYLCGYSHSGFESVMQLSTDEGISEQDVRGKQNILYLNATYLLAHFCKSYGLHSVEKGCEIVDDFSDVDHFLRKYQSVYS
ncbi:hypothetical protein [Pseudoalteromonas ruthenica]|uniref:hypothetical protein n=1 Tax=Pseudoalteromonas ruthenica TaxID=151081 RepID=UPI0003B62FF0|nr:hypothetical protein [Pseudoalteromonas ruthenica]